jgi:hypothetical protein
MIHNIKPKTAYIEFDCPIEDFFEEWGDGNDTEPIQEDYDNWASRLARPAKLRRVALKNIDMNLTIT